MKGQTFVSLGKSVGNCPVRFALFAPSEVIQLKSKGQARIACDDRSPRPASHLDSYVCCKNRSMKFEKNRGRIPV